MGTLGTGNLIRRALSAAFQPLIWLLLVAGLLSAPLLSRSQNSAQTSQSQINPWLQRYDAAMRLYEAGNYRAAYSQFQMLADYGSAGAQTMLGHLYAAGKGVERSPSKAALWYIRAAERGYAPAQIALGRSYARGLGVDKDIMQAALWLSLAANRGEVPVRQIASKELRQIIKSFTEDDLIRLETLRRRWRPDVALMP